MAEDARVSPARELPWRDWETWAELGNCLSETERTIRVFNFLSDRIDSLERRLLLQEHALRTALGIMEAKKQIEDVGGVLAEIQDCLQTLKDDQEGNNETNGL